MTVRERLVSGTVVLRERRIVYASAGAAAVLQREARDLMGRVFLELVAPEERERIADRYARRLRGESVPSEYEIVLLFPGGDRRTVAAHVSLEGKDEVVVRLRDLSDQTERRGRLLGLAELGVAIQRERTEGAIHERVQEGLFALGLASLLLRQEAAGVRLRWVRVPSAVRAVLEAHLGGPATGALGRLTPFLRTAWEEGAVFADGFIHQAAAFLSSDHGDAARALTAAEALVRGLAVRLEERAGPSACLVVAGDWIGPGDVPAFRLFAAQVAAALDSARAIGELSSRNFDLAALNRLGELAGGAVGLAEFLPRAGEVVRATAGCAAVAVYAAGRPPGHLALIHAAGLPQALVDRIGRASMDGPLGATLGERQPRVVQLDELPEPLRDAVAQADLRSFAYVPLAVRSRVFGVMALAWRERRGEAACRTDLLLAMGAHLAAALEADHLLGDLRRRAEELSLLQDVGRTLVETLELDQVLAAGVKNLARMVDAPEAYLVLLDEASGDLVVQAVSGPGQAQLGFRVPFDPAISTAARCMARREPLVLEEVPDGSPAFRALRALSGMRTGLVLPLLVRDKAIGAAIIGETRASRRFTAAELQLATAVANQLAVAVDNARAHASALAALTDLQQAQERLLHRERLAALGELSAVVAHEVRNPLGVIFNSLGSLRRLVRPEGDARTLLDIVGEEADRLNRIVGDLLDFARPAPPQLRPERLERLADEAVAAALAQQPTAVELVREPGAPLPPVALDARQVRQALLNVAANAVQAMPRGGRLTVRLGLEGDAAVVELSDTGAGIPDDVRGRIFEPFFTTKATGSGLGLAVVKRIMDGHGGEIGVRCLPDQGTTFSLRFPLSPMPAVELAGHTDG